MKRKGNFIVSFDDLTEHDKQEIQSLMYFKRLVLADRKRKDDGAQKEREQESKT